MVQKQSAKRSLISNINNNQDNMDLEYYQIRKSLLSLMEVATKDFGIGFLFVIDKHRKKKKSAIFTDNRLK